ncbi:MmcB family DNA repair protein [Thalassobaculum sp.]|uniref:MmcB family DNA repair protein n=1 Tax=Thalassobaculum sp. TaxID=2022740 RepID=UPI0032EA9178
MSGAADGGDSVPEITRAVTRGAARLFEDLGCAVVTELTLANGRRADVAALAADGRITMVEVKSGVPDFRSDAKWSEYLEFCDSLYFAVAPTFPLDLLPDAATCGVIVADAWEATILRPAPVQLLAAARRRAMTIRIARVAALRLRAFTDPRL